MMLYGIISSYGQSYLWNVFMVETNCSTRLFGSLNIVKRKRGHFIAYRHNSTSIYIYEYNIDGNGDEDKATVNFPFFACWACTVHTRHTIPYHTVYVRIWNESNGKIEPAGTSERFNFNSNRVSFLCFATSCLPQLLHLLYSYCCTT